MKITENGTLDEIIRDRNSQGKWCYGSDKSEIHLNEEYTKVDIRKCYNLRE